MANELEKKFFNAFEIKPKYTYLVTDMFYTSDSHSYEVTKNDLIKYFGDKNCGRYKVMEVYKTYPQITDRILLNLICIANEYLDYPTSTNIKNIQARTLRMLLKVKKYFKDTYSSQDWHNELVRKVRKLFKGDNNV